MGGLIAGAIEPIEHDYALWEKRVDAILVLLSSKGVMTVDEMRRNIESLSPDAYDRMTYMSAGYTRSLRRRYSVASSQSTT